MHRVTRGHILILFSMCLVCLPTYASEPWEGPAFSGDPVKILEAAQAATAPEGTQAIVLLEETRFVFDEVGRSTRTIRQVYRILNETGVRDLGTVSIRWSPWRHDRPSLRARVISAARPVHILDPQTIEDSLERHNDPEIYHDLRKMRAPLPGGLSAQPLARSSKAQSGAGAVRTGTHVRTRRNGYRLLALRYAQAPVHHERGRGPMFRPCRAA